VEAAAGGAHVHYLEKPSIGSEDFSAMLARKTGSYIILGARKDAQTAQLHSPHYDFNDDILPLGAAYWVALTEQALRAD
jgi:hippurate hydrolase